MITGRGRDDGFLIRVWNLYNGKCVMSLKGHKDQVNSLIPINEYILCSASRGNKF